MPNWLCRLLRIPAFFCRFFWRRHVMIACYHSIDSRRFEAHVEVLQRRYNLISLDTLVTGLERRDWGLIPDWAMVITFDDGAKDFYELRDVLQRRRVPVTHYLVSSLLGTHRHFWFKEAADADSLKQLPEDARAEHLARQRGHSAQREYETRQALSLEEARELMAVGTVFGAHTATHPILPQCPDEAAWEEIRGCKRELEDKLGVPVHHFSYPNGDCCLRDEQIVRKAGFRSARLVELGTNGIRTDPFRLKIVDVLEDRSAADLELIDLRLAWYAIRGRLGLGRSKQRKKNG